MTAQKDSISNKMISGLLLTAGISGLFFTAQAQATEYMVTDGQLAPNPNQAGDVIRINGPATNSNDYENAGAIDIFNGAYLSNSPLMSSPVFINNKAGVLTNSGALVTLFEGGGASYSASQISNQATLINTDIGTTIRNLNGAGLYNGHPSGLIFPTPSGIDTPSTAIFNNRQGATVTNSGVYGVTFSGYTNYESSVITNYATLTNSDAGSVINNENGAALNNGGNHFFLDNSSSPSTATMVNNNGAVINNSGRFTWQDNVGNSGYNIGSSINNNATFSNSGENTHLNNLNGAVLINGAQNWMGGPAASNTLLTNENAATLTNSGLFTHVSAGDPVILAPSTVININATLLNTGAGSQLINQHGGVIENRGNASGFNQPGILSNENGAILTNSGAYVWQDGSGVARVSQTSINNDTAVITNSGAGSRLENLNGAVLDNGAVLNNGGWGWIGSANTTLTNQNGATLTNSGVYHWQDGNGQNQTTASMINNQGTLINTGTGSSLNNLSGAQLNNAFGTLKNLDGALLANGAGASIDNSNGHIINDALMTNAGSFQTSLGSLEGSGHYIQTAGETVIGNGSQWTQAVTEIQGGVLRGNGGLNGDVVIDGGTWVVGGPGIVSTDPLATPVPIINGDLSVNSGLIKINVGSDGLPIFGFFGNPFDLNNQGNGSLLTSGLFANQPPLNGETLDLGGGGLLLFDPSNPFPVYTSHAVSDALAINGSASFNGGVVEIDFLNGYVPSLGESLAWLTATGSISGLENIQYRFTGLANDRSLAFNHDGNHLTWTVTTAPVPLPAAGWLFIAGLLGMFQASRPKIRTRASCSA